MEKICYAYKCMVLLRSEKHLDLRTLNVCTYVSMYTYIIVLYVIQITN